MSNFRIRAAQEAERKRIEEESRKAAELERQLEKKRKKKESQRLKKLAAKGNYSTHFLTFYEVFSFLTEEVAWQAKASQPAQRHAKVFSWLHVIQCSPLITNF